MDEACLREKQKHAYELMKDTPYLQVKIDAGGETVFPPSQMLEWSWHSRSLTHLPLLHDRVKSLLLSHAHS